MGFKSNLQILVQNPTETHLLTFQAASRIPIFQDFFFAKMNTQSQAVALYQGRPTQAVEAIMKRVIAVNSSFFIATTKSSSYLLHYFQDQSILTGRTAVLYGPVNSIKFKTTTLIKGDPKYKKINLLTK